MNRYQILFLFSIMTLFCRQPLPAQELLSTPGEAADVALDSDDSEGVPLLDSDRGQDEGSKLVEAAVAYLEAIRNPDGTWGDANIPFSHTGITPLATIAMQRSGMMDAEQLQAALELCAEIEGEETYVVSLQTIALCESGEPAYSDKIEANVEWLSEAQRREGLSIGGWSYMNDGGRTADGSNTRFAIWALSVALKHGFEVAPATLHLAVGYWVNNQHENGGWGYVAGIGDSTASMTLSGITSLLRLRPYLKEDDPLLKKIEPAVVAAWQVGGLEEQAKGVRNYPYYTWQLLSLASKLSAEIDEVRDVIPNKERIVQVLNDRLEADGSLENSSLSPAIGASFAVIAIKQWDED